LETIADMKVNYKGKLRSFIERAELGLDREIELQSMS
jgi:hypothetical protein